MHFSGGSGKTTCRPPGCGGKIHFGMQAWLSVTGNRKAPGTFATQIRSAQGDTVLAATGKG